MTRLIWDAEADRTYEYGVDRGILNYRLDVPKPWNGLISVEESEQDAIEVRAAFDGFTHLNLRFGGNYRCVVTAYSLPDGFQELVGEASLVPGFILTGQARVQFDFSYRTMQGPTGYKLHVVHNAVASTLQAQSTTMKATGEASEFKWRIDAVPPNSTIHRPTSHMIIDSVRANPTSLLNLENLLYGTSGTTPSFPDQATIRSLF